MNKNYNIELDYILEELIVEYETLNKGLQFYSDEAPLSINEKVTQKVMEKFGLQEWETNILFYTLLTDKYLKNSDPLSISLEGLVFRNNGGYVQKEINDKKESLKVESIQNDFRKYSFGLMVFTAIVALGTIISAVYFLIEIYKYFIELGK